MPESSQRRSLSHRRSRVLPARTALTLVEVIVVTGVIALLVGVLLPAIQHAQESSRRAACKNNLRQIALATRDFYEARRHFPPGQWGAHFGKGPDSRAWSWLAQLLPYVEEQTLYDSGKIPAATLRQSGVIHKQIALFLCPSDGYSDKPRDDAGGMQGVLTGQTNYQGVTGANWGADASQKKDDIGTDWRNKGTNGSFDGLNNGDGVMWRTDFQKPRSLRHVKDGTSKTFLAGECLPEKNNYTCWPYANGAYATCAIPPNVAPVAGRDYSPAWWPNTGGFRSSHPGGLLFACIDASVAWVDDEIDLVVYRAKATVAGGD